MGVMRFDLAQGETLSIDEGRVRVTLEQKSGSRARLRIQAEDEIVVGMDDSERRRAEPQKILRRPEKSS